MTKEILPKFKRLMPLIPALLLSGCTLDLLDPRGPVGRGNRDVMLLEMGVMLCIIIPVIIMTLFFAWKYRESNTKAEYLPTWDHSTKIECFVWGIPAVVILILGVVCVWSSYYYDPYRKLTASDPSRKPLNVEVVALDWKWLFIYPDQGVAAINQLAIPVDRPINFLITSDAVMTSFFIPRLGSQVYAMAGMQTQLHLLADAPGDYLGQASNYTGAGFSDMRFRALAMNDGDFDAWVEKVKQSPNALDSSTYPDVAAPQQAAPVTYYGRVQPSLFDGIVAKYNNGMVMNKSTGQMMHMQPAPSEAQMKE
ncbi:ubiquinol oxidase subunit II [Candidatus Kirkpatrickella diaphorinae]|uniref:Ubiquinol oxidase subunit 2 n=1 Tax=Candidatus Kirkpatrickella diaphorinae TaxID=2984322 RepID=A0ABY6GKQ3_9PROT|nr:ubiquinol oxidase subunit II [Candidatus Kirkpatrickella diaphorinae]UYH52117.1 ubiquinol oxidase subunit II [Candidatus Kirkpatrickella diaphorinae]